jgi:hypothetical protein
MAHTRTVSFAAGVLVTALLWATLSADISAQERRLHISLGGGFTTPNPEVRDQLGNGYNFTFGIQFDLTPIIGIEGFLSTNELGDRRLSIPVTLTPGTPSIPTDFSVAMSMQLATTSLVVQRPDGRARPYGVAGIGVYDRPVTVTTLGGGLVEGYCDPWWYVCYSGGFVPVSNIIGRRSSTDAGMIFGGGVSLGPSFFAEARYHHIWGPTIEATPLNPPAAIPAPQKVDGQFFVSTVGVRF